ncbi:hypothetical protein ACSBR2_012092 [Camellia fascicularis]
MHYHWNGNSKDHDHPKWILHTRSLIHIENIGLRCFYQCVIGWLSHVKLFIYFWVS